MPRKVRRQLRAALHNWAQGKRGDDSLDRLAGLAAYIYMTDPEKGSALLERIQKLTDRTTAPAESGSAGSEQTSDDNATPGGQS